MVYLTTPKLVISHNHTQQTATVKVTAKLYFSFMEQGLIKLVPNGKLFHVKGEIYGDDPGNDKRLSYLQPFFLTNSDLSLTGHEIEFTSVVPDSTLDEDLDGTDEIYAKITVKNTLSFEPTKKSNVYKHIF